MNCSEVTVVDILIPFLLEWFIRIFEPCEKIPSVYFLMFAKDIH